MVESSCKGSKNTRMCVFCRKKAFACDFLRVVRLPDGTVVIDDSGKKNGRGAYVCPSERCITGAQRHRSIEKALKTHVHQDVYDNLLRRVDSLDE